MHSTTHPIPFTLPTDVPCVVSLTTIAQHLETLIDQRKRRGVRYPLVPMLLTALLAKLCGEQHLAGIAHWARLRGPELAPLLGLSRTMMPHASTWSRLLADAVDATALEQALGRAMRALAVDATVPERGSRVLVIDGKTLRGTIPLGATQGDHLLAAYLPHEGVVVFQLPVDGKTNEITVAPQVLARLDLQGVVVTGDALHTQRALSAQIVEAGGDYLWTVKDNQPTLAEDLAILFDPQVLAAGEGPVPTDFVVVEHHEKGHGRQETRRITVSQLLADYSEWPYLQQAFRIERWATDGLGRTRVEVGYGVTSLPPTAADAARLLEIMRLEWGIENGLHYRRDVTLGEDACQVRRGTAPQVLAALNNTSVGIAALAKQSNLPAMRRDAAFQVDRCLARRTAT